MNKTIWTTLVVFGVAATFNSGNLFARGGQGNATNTSNNNKNAGQPNNSGQGTRTGNVGQVQTFQNHNLNQLQGQIQNQNQQQQFRQNLNQQVIQNQNQINQQLNQQKNQLNQQLNQNPLLNKNVQTQNQKLQNLNLGSGISGSPQVGHHPGVVNGIQQGTTGNQALNLNTNQNQTFQNQIKSQIQQHQHQNQTQNQNNPNLNLGKLQNLGQQNLSNLNQTLHHQNAGNNALNHLNHNNLNNLNLNNIAHLQNKKIGGNGFTPLYISGHQHNHIGNPQQQVVANKLAFGNNQIYLGKPNYLPSYNYHTNCYHGYWNLYYGNNFGGYGWNSGYPYGSYYYLPYFWGLGGWGLGSMVYGCGYVNYYNPYYVMTPTTIVYNYAQPIPVAYNAQIVAVDPNQGTTTEQALNSAIAAFKQNNYDQALDIVNKGINQHPDDAVLHEFRGLVLFAKGDYQQAAATVHSVLAVGPGWNWTTLSGMYADVNLYTMQLRALEATVKANPDNAAARFLLAYHYMSDGYPDSAVPQLQKVVTLVPNDQVSANLLKMLNPPKDAGTLAQSTSPSDVNLPSPDQTPATPVDPASIVGDWKSSRDDGSTFNLKLTGEKTFAWTYKPKDQAPQSFEGKYTLEGNTIALEREGGGSLVAQITRNDASNFNFKMVGAPDEDPGLSFVR